MHRAPRWGPSALPVAQRPAALIAGLYLVLAATDLFLLDGVVALGLGGAAVLASLSVSALALRRPDQLTAWSTAAIAVVTLAAHVAAATSRPLMVVMLALAAASAWGAVSAAGVRANPVPTRQRGVARPSAAEPLEPAPVDVAPEPVADPPPEELPDPRERLMAGAGKLVAGTVVSLVEPDGAGNLAVTASTRRSLIGLTFPAGSTSATEHVYRTGRRLFLADPRSEPLVSPTHLNRTEVASMLWQPVRVAGVPCAVLVVGWPDHQEQVQQLDVQAINLMAEQAAGFLEQESLLADLQHFESTDVLTGLDSRAAWDAQLEELMAGLRETGQSLVVAIIDLDHFRAFNDSHGHAAGDAHLARFARAARATLRCDGLIARWGGEEFAVALTAITPAAAHGVLDRVRLAVPDGRTCSIGFAVWDEHESSALLLSRADRGMRRAKEAGRNQICQAS